MTRIHIAGLFAALSLPLAGCSTSMVDNANAAATATVSKAQADLQLAIKLYEIAKGTAQVAEVAEPALVPVVSVITSNVDPNISKAQTVLNDASVDAAAIEQLASSITAQANALTVKAAPVVLVVPNPVSAP